VIFGRDDGQFVLAFSEAESELMHSLIVEYLYLIGGQHDGPLPARLFPAGYRDDPEAAEAFGDATLESLRARKIDNAELVSTAAALEPPIRLGMPVVERWLPTLTDLRLLIAERIGLETDGDEVPDTDHGLIYLWLGHLQEAMLTALWEEGAE
jgi:hypothetical protein